METNPLSSKRTRCPATWLCSAPLVFRTRRPTFRTRRHLSRTRRPIPRTQADDGRLRPRPDAPLSARTAERGPPPWLRDHPVARGTLQRALLPQRRDRVSTAGQAGGGGSGRAHRGLSLIHISEPTRRTPISYAVFCLKKKK